MSLTAKLLGEAPMPIPSPEENRAKIASYQALTLKVKRRLAAIAHDIVYDVTDQIGDRSVEVANEFSEFLPEEEDAVFEDFTADVETWLREAIAKEVVKG